MAYQGPTAASLRGQQHRWLKAPPSAITIDDIKGQLRQSSEYLSTFLSLALSALVLVLQVVAALSLTGSYPYDHHIFWLFLVVARLANLFALCCWVDKFDDEDTEPGTGVPVESELGRKMRLHPWSASLLLFLGVCDTEVFCFLTTDEKQQRAFRKLSSMNILFGDLPFAIAGLFFMLNEGFTIFTMMVPWAITMVVMILKILRRLIIEFTESCQTEAKLPLFRNLRCEDFLLFPWYVIHFFICFFLIFLCFTGTSGGFAHNWLNLQLSSYSGFSDNQTAMLDAVLLPDVNATWLTQLWAEKKNWTAVNSSWYTTTRTGDTGDTGDDVTKYINFPVSRFTTKELASIVMPDAWADEIVLANAAQFLNPTALGLLEEWEVLRQRFLYCTLAGLFLWIAHMAVSLILTIVYLKRQSYADSFQTKLTWRGSMQVAFVVGFSIASSNTLNAITQDRRGYAIVKRDAAISMICLVGIPMVVIAASIESALDCRNRSCDVLHIGVGATTWTTVALISAVPLVWFQLLTLFASLIALRSQSDKPGAGSSTKGDDQEALDESEPVSPEEKSWRGVVGLVGGLTFSLAVWLIQLIYLVALAWNSPISTVTIGGRPSHEWGSSVAGEYIAAIDFGSANPTHEPVLIDGNWTWILIDPPLPWFPKLTDGYFRTNTIIWVIGVMLNIAVIAYYMAYSATPKLRQRVEQGISLTALAFTLTAVSPEAMRVTADQRRDVMMLRKLTALPALALDMPIMISSTLVMCDHGSSPFLYLVAIMSGFHWLISLTRAGLVALTEQLRRPPIKLEGRAERFATGDLVLSAFSAMHCAFMLALIGLYHQGSYFGISYGMEESHVSWSGTAGTLMALILTVYLVASTCISVSYLNHWIYTTASVSERSYTSSFFLFLASFDLCWLNFLSEDAVHVAEIKRIALFASAVGWFGPTLLVQVIMVFMVQVNWEPYDLNRRADLVAGETLQNCAVAATIIIGVWKLLRLVMIHQNLARERIERERYERERRDRERGYEQPRAPNEHIPEAQSPFMHTLPWSIQWRLNRQAPEGFDPRRGLQQQQQQPSPYGVTVTGAYHVMGYAIDEDGNYMFDEDGNYVMADGVSYMFDEDGNYVLDEDGNYVLDGIVSDAPPAGDADDYQEGGEGFGDNVTNTSRSTDISYAAESNAEPNAYGGGFSDPNAYSGSYGEGNGEASTDYGYGEAAAEASPGVAPAEMLEIKCAQRALFTTPDGFEGVFVSLQTSADQSMPFLFVQAHEVRPLKQKRFGRSGPQQVSLSYLSVDVGALDRDYVEQNVYEEPEMAWRALQESNFDAGLAVDGDQYSWDQGSEGYRGHADVGDAALPVPAPLPPPDAGVPAGAEMAQRL